MGQQGENSFLSKDVRMTQSCMTFREHLTKHQCTIEIHRNNFSEDEMLQLVQLFP